MAAENYDVAKFRQAKARAAADGAGRSATWNYDRALEHREDALRALRDRGRFGLRDADDHEMMAEAHFRIAANMRHAASEAAKRHGNPARKSVGRKALPKRRADGTFAPKRR
jgi:hypothetical protein